MLGDLFYQLGAVLGGLDAQVRGKAGAARADGGREVAVYDPDTGDVYDLEDDAEETVVNAAIAAAGAWLLARALRPRPVSWPRAVLAGVAATTIADLVGRRIESEEEPGRSPYADDPEELMARFGAGIAIAAGYAAVLHPRIPGPPLFKGLVFGVLEIAAAPRGGLVGLAADAPGVKFPLQALALPVPVDEDAGPLSHLAFGLALGLLYRSGDGHDDVEHEEKD